MLFVSKVLFHNETHAVLQHEWKRKKTAFPLTYSNVHTFSVHSRVTLNYCTIIPLQ